MEKANGKLPTTNYPNKPKLRSVLVVPESSKKSGAFPLRPGRHSNPVKVWRPVSKEVPEARHPDHGSHGWEEVRRKHHKPKETAVQPAQRRPVHTRLGPVPNGRPSVHLRLGPSPSELFKKQVAGRCFKCLATDHQVANCRDPPRCIRYLRSGHRARHCKAPPPKAASTTINVVALPPPVPASTTDFHPLPTMPPLRSIPVGHHTKRPKRVMACASSTSALAVDEAKFSRCGVVSVYPAGEHRSATTDEVRVAIETQLLVPSSEMVVSMYPPTGFLVLFSDYRLRDHAIVDSHGVNLGGLILHFRPWSSDEGAANAHLPFKMRLCLEGVPPHARQPDTLKQLFDPATLIEGIDAPTSTRRRPVAASRFGRRTPTVLPWKAPSTSARCCEEAFFSPGMPRFH